jgi:hypothetical protein
MIFFSDKFSGRNSAHVFTISATKHACLATSLATSATQLVSIRQHTSAYVSIRQHASATSLATSVTQLFILFFS